MAEVEYKGIKIGGSKLLLVLPLVGTIIGGLWGGFELYNRYLMMVAARPDRHRCHPALSRLLAPPCNAPPV